MIFKFFDRLEDKIRRRLSRRPLIYAFIGSIGIILIWRGIWMIADNLNIPGWLSVLSGIAISMATGLFVSFFVGDTIIISGIKEEKRIDEATEEEIKREGMILAEIHKDVGEIKKQLTEIKKNASLKQSKLAVNYKP